MADPWFSIKRAWLQHKVGVVFKNFRALCAPIPHNPTITKFLDPPLYGGWKGHPLRSPIGPNFPMVQVIIRGSLDSHRLSYTRDHHVRNEHAHWNLGSTLVYKAVWTLSKLGLSLHGVADPHRTFDCSIWRSNPLNYPTLFSTPFAVTNFSFSSIVIYVHLFWCVIWW